MVAGLRMSDPRATSSLTPKAKGKQAKASTQAAVKFVNGAVCVKSVKTVAAAGRDSLGAIMDEGLAELNQFLSVHPERILVTLRMAKDEAYFRMKPRSSEQWIHSTLVYLSGVPKKFWKQLLLAYRLATTPSSPWTECLLKQMDKMQALEGIANAVSYLGLVSMQDNLPAALHYKPLLHDVMLERMLSKSLMLEIATDGSVKFGKDKGVYAFGGLTSDVYTTIVHLPTRVSVNICDDFKVGLDGWDLEDNHDWVRAVLVGKRAKESIYKMFLDEGKAAQIGYDKETFLDDLIEEHLVNHEGEMTKTSGIDAMVRPAVIADVSS
jgi:hypothetical protein